MLELNCEAEFDVACEKEFFAALPARTAVCLIEPREAAASPLLIRTQDLRRRLQRLLGPVDPASKRLNLREFARGVRYRITGSPFEQLFAYYQNAKRMFPARYRDLLRLRPPAVLKVNLRNAYPRCFVTRRIPMNEAGAPVGGAYYGPFASRKVADAFAERALDLFKVRRCQIKIRRDPTFPGCIYSDMKMCLAPCFGGCTAEDYGSEVERLKNFLDTNGESLRVTLENERERASEELNFERASAVHKKLDKLDEVLRGRPELAGRVENLHAVILQRGASEQTIAAYPVRGGWLTEPFFLNFAEMASQPRSAEQTFRDALENTGKVEDGERGGSAVERPQNVERGDFSEHLWLIARWFYSNPRDGEIFFREKDWPYRRILRACARLLAKTPENDGTAPQAEQGKPQEGRT